MGTKLRRWPLIVVLAIGAIAALGAVGLHVATRVLKQQVERALGPESTVGEIAVNWSAVEVRQLRIRGPKGWPAKDALRADRVVIAPDVRALLSAEVRLRRITVEKGYISIVRSPEGRLRLLPSLLDKPGAKSSKDAFTGPAVAIGNIEVAGGVLEFYDATVRRPPHKLRLEQLRATIDGVHVPDLSGRTQIRLDGVVKGVKRDGTLAIHGWAELASRDSEITTTLRHVDLIAFQPYLIKASETGVRSGTLDMDLKSTVHKNALYAPGKLMLAGLELTSGTFMGMPRQAVLSALKNKNGQITMRFTLEGNINDPKFSLNESLATRIGSGVADSLGVSIEGLARGAGDAARGIGDTVRRLFSQ